MSSSSSSQSRYEGAGASSSRGAFQSSAVEIDSANDDLAIHRVEDAELLLEDPLHSTLPDSTSFKRKHKASLGFSLPRLLSPVHSNTDRAAYASYSIRNPSTRIDRDRSSDDTRATPETNLSYPYTSADGGSEIQDNKDGGTLDWQAEGP
ncbi:chloride channel, partial [Cryomyces antarcticus]